MKKKKTILVIDDDHSLVKILELILRREGFEVISTFDGLDGLITAKSIQPDLIILDVVMPGIDGYGVCRYLHDEPTTASIPIIMLTVKGRVNMSEDQSRMQRDMDERVRARIEGFEAGAIDFLSKPIIAKDVIARVKRVLGMLDSGKA